MAVNDPTTISISLDLYNRLKAIGEAGDTRSEWVRRAVEKAEDYQILMDRHIRVCGLVTEGIELVMGDLDIDPVDLKGWARRMEKAMK